MEGHIYIYQEIGGAGVTARAIQRELARMTDAQEVTVHISSPGGEVYEGYTIYNLLKNSGKKINVKIEGLCASIATLIAMAGDSITMTPLSEFMIHNPSGAIEGDARAMKDAATQLDAIKKTLVKAYKKRTKLSEAELWEMMDKETYLSPKEAIKLGFVDSQTERLKAVAYLDITKKTNKMSKLEQLIAKVDTLIKNTGISKIKNLETSLDNGTPIMIEGEEVVQGAAVFIVTPEGQQPAPDGEHVLVDGTVIAVVGGKIESVGAPVEDKDEEKDALKAENEALKTQLAEMTAKATEADNKATELNTNLTNYAEQLTAIKAELEEVKNLTVGAQTVQATASTKVVQNIKKDHPLDGFAKSLVSLHN
jgi:ATP-dependent protease ClpP protease subunit